MVVHLVVNGCCDGSLGIMQFRGLIICGENSGDNWFMSSWPECVRSNTVSGQPN